MKEHGRRIFVGVGSIASIFLVLGMVLFSVAYAALSPHPHEGPTDDSLSIGAVALFLFVLSACFVFSTICSRGVDGPAWRRTVLVGVNVLGALVAGGFSLCVVAIWVVCQGK